LAAASYWLFNSASAGGSFRISVGLASNDALTMRTYAQIAAQRAREHVYSHETEALTILL